MTPLPLMDAEEILRLQSVSVSVLARQPEAVCTLARGLDDARPEVGRAAAATLEKMVRLHRLRPQHLPAGFPAEARQVLLDRLARSQSAEVRRLAAEALREAEQVEAAAGFLDGLADPDAAVRAACLAALERLRLGPAHLDRIEALLALGPQVDREPGLQAGREPGSQAGREPGSQASPQVGPATERGADQARSPVRAAARRAVLDALAAHMDRDLLLRLAPRLAALLADDDAAVRIRAAHLLGPVDPPPAALWPVLAETLGHGDPWHRTAALRRLAALGPRGLPHLPAVLAAAADENAAVRSHALTALAAIAPGDARVRDALLAALRDPASPPRRAAVSALAGAGPDPATIADLAAVAADAGAPGPARTAAVEALGALRATRAVPALIQALATMDMDVAEAAAEALGHMGPAARAAAGALERLLGHDALRMTAATALVAMGAAGPGLRTALRVEAREGEEWSRELARALLDELG